MLRHQTLKIEFIKRHILTFNSTFTNHALISMICPTQMARLWFFSCSYFHDQESNSPVFQKSEFFTHSGLILYYLLQARFAILMAFTYLHVVHISRLVGSNKVHQVNTRSQDQAGFKPPLRCVSYRYAIVTTSAVIIIVRRTIFENNFFFIWRQIKASVLFFAKSYFLLIKLPSLTES